MLRERAVLVALFLVTALLMFGVTRCGGSGAGQPSNGNAHVIPPGNPPVTGNAAPAALRSPTPTSSASSSASSGAGRNGTLYAGGQLVLPMERATRVGPDGDLRGYSGRAVGTGLRVMSVPADEGFWVGGDGRDRVWVELTGDPSESPYDVDRYDYVSFTGTLVGNRPGFARSAGVTDREGRDLLEDEGRHVTVRKDALRLSS